MRLDRAIHAEWQREAGDHPGIYGDKARCTDSCQCRAYGATQRGKHAFIAHIVQVTIRHQMSFNCRVYDVAVLAVVLDEQVAAGVALVVKTDLAIGGTSRPLANLSVD